MKNFLSKARFGVLALVASLAAILPMATVAAAAARVFEVTNSWVTSTRQSFVLGANTLTGLIPALYSALDIVSRELVGAIPAATRDATADRAAVGQNVVVFKTPNAVATDIAPAVTPPNDGDQTIGNTAVTITKARRVPFRWNGEETLGVNNNGAGAAAIQADQLQQAIRTLVNEMEVDVVNAARIASSRAYGTAGTTPFATDLSDPAQLRKILDDNGAPGERALIIDTTAGAKLRTMGQLTKANEAGTTMTLRDGALLDLHGFVIKESAGVGVNVKGTGAAYTSTTAGFPVGTTSIPLITGTGTVLAGDIVTFAGDTNKYVVETGIAAPGTIVLAAPGLRQAIPAAATAMTIGANYTGNVGFSRSSLILATRAPALPDGGDMAIDRTLVTDPRSGITFEVAMYAQYRQMQYEISAAWGVKGIKSNHSAILLG
ncbi:P22 coat - protein 5 family protein [Variovorax sp. RO1]|uniref:P22 coat - protein 5 family protein n=1 Tax=Variovorax sp. RO1 TaxID=2066034 RepID=UPI000C71690D|nr:P22 coat - protein 5 family protein [Variovorax sp. RO1]PLC06402.1 P22 coat - protein 5 family protein [Variovorax sp. RO1]